MATVAHAVAAIARGLDIPQSIVRQNGRNLREAGLLPTSPGCRPVDISADQIALVLIASLVPCHAKDAALVARNYGGLEAGDTSLLQALAAVLKGGRCERLEVNLNAPGATLVRGTEPISFGCTAPAPALRTVSVTGAALQNIAAALRGTPPSKRRRRRH